MDVLRPSFSFPSRTSCKRGAREEADKEAAFDRARVLILQM